MLESVYEIRKGQVRETASIGFVAEEGNTMGTRSLRRKGQSARHVSRGLSLADLLGILLILVFLGASLAALASERFTPRKGQTLDWLARGSNQTLAGAEAVPDGR